MKPVTECAQCLINWAYNRTEPYASEDQRHALMADIMGVLSRDFTQSGNIALISNKILEVVYEFVLASSDFYNELKAKANQAVAELLPVSREFIESGKTPQERFERACCLASVGNVTPIGAPTGALKFPEAENILTGKGPLPAVMGDIYEAAVNATHVLFLPDNAGEIGFDSLVIEELRAMGARVTLAVKENFLFEDATIDDAAHFGLDKLVDDILTTPMGVFVPGESTSSVEEAYRQSDLVIAKGGYNFEAVEGEISGKPVIYMLKMKCGPFCDLNHAAMNSFVVRLENREQRD